MESVQIKDIEPFNDTFFKHNLLRGCFYTALFTVIRFSGRSVLPFLVNEIYLYDYDENKFNLTIKNKPLKADKEIMDSEGLRADSKLRSDDLIKDIELAVSNNRPVVAVIDCYYDPTRKDAYMKEHLAHWTLTYGFNCDEETLDIMHHVNKASLYYEKASAGYNHMVESYNGFFENMYEPVKMNLENGIDFPTYYEYYFDKGSCGHAASVYLATYAYNIILNKCLIFDKIQELNHFIDDARKLIVNPDTLSENTDKLMSIINDIITIKRVELYTISELKQIQVETVEILDNIVKDWEFVRAMIVKYKFINIYNRVSFDSVSDRLGKIVCSEYKYYASLASELQKFIKK